MKYRGIYLRIVWRAVNLALLCLVINVSASYSQEPAGQQLAAPPPLKIIPRDERARIDGTDDSKARLRTTIELAELRLAKAEVLTSDQNFDERSRRAG